MSRIAAQGLRAAGLLVLAGLALAGCAQAPRTAATTASHADGSLRLAPDPAFSGGRLVAVLGEDAPDPSTLRFEWRRNGRLIDGAAGPELDPALFAKGDRIAVWVTLPARAGGYARELTAETKIANSAPRIASAGIALESGPSGPELRANVECLDPDGDPPRLECRWSVNGAPVKGTAGTSLPASGLARGDRVTLAVTAHDPDSESLEATADFTLENRAPSFTSQPAAPRPGEATFEYRAAAADPDGDALVFSLDRGPDGMTVSPRGEVRWDLPAGAAAIHGEFPVRLRAADAHGGEAVQEFTIRL